MWNLVVGLGEVGCGVFKVLEGRTKVMGRDKEPRLIAEKIDILHICLPYTDTFEDDVKGYIKLYKPLVTIVYSTVPIGTCERLKVVHSPVEGRHPKIDEGIMSMPRYVGSSDNKALTIAKKLWEPFMPVRALPSANFTEFLKLRSTSKYGINIAWANYEQQVAEELGMDFVAIQQFDIDYNMLYMNLGFPRFKRYILDKPNGEIGGHCVVPNAKLLDKQYPSAMLKEITKLEKKK